MSSNTLTKILIILLWFTGFMVFIVTITLYEIKAINVTSNDYWTKQIHSNQEKIQIKNKLLDGLNSIFDEKKVVELNEIKQTESQCFNDSHKIIHYQIPLALNYIISNEDIFSLLKNSYTNLMIEKAFLISLNNINEIVEIKQIASGDNMRVEYCLQDILNTKGKKIIIVHNHPGLKGIPIPSSVDVTTGKKILEVLSATSDKKLVNFAIWTEFALGAPKLESVTSLSKSEMDNWKTMSNIFCSWGAKINIFNCSSYSTTGIDDILESLG